MQQFEEMNWHDPHITCWLVFNNGWGCGGQRGGEGGWGVERRRGRKEGAKTGEIKKINKNGRLEDGR